MLQLPSIPLAEYKERIEKVQNVIKYMLHYITPEDYKAAKEYIPYPADYDFFKILNWDSNEF